MLQIGIECESIEDTQTWGVGREVRGILKTIASKPELQKEFTFFLFFKSKIPELPYLNGPIFKKIIIRTPFNSFSIYYYLFLPIYLWFRKMDAVYFPNYMLPVIFRGRSLVALTDDVFFEAQSDKLPLRYRMAYRIFSTWAAKHATRVVTFSESSRRAVSRLFEIPIDKISANYHGIDIYGAVLKNFELKITNFCLYVGQAFPRRHLKETLAAFEKISQRFPDLDFVVVGKDKYDPPLIYNSTKDINDRLGREAVRYKTYISEDELLELYRKAKFVVYVSDREAFGLPPIEALGYGSVPVVADAEVTREIFGDKAFFVSNPITVETIVDAMSRALTDEPKKNEIKSSAQHIVEKFTWSVHTERFLRMIKDIAV